YLLDSSRVLFHDIILRLELFTQYDEAGKIWIARAMIPLVVFLSLPIAYFLLAHFDLLNYFYLFLVIFTAPLFIILTLLSFL
ncbi:MAG: hypothetical protein K2P99_02975, partial [Burkholderiales bacterium]|nr:hypothetical protein [Burkholderiales bacterium]